LDFSTDFRKLFKYQFNENPSRGSRVAPFARTDGRTDGHDEANSSFPHFCERKWV